MATKDSGKNMTMQARKLQAIIFFRNVLPECNLILESQLTAANCCGDAASQLRRRIPLRSIADQSFSFCGKARNGESPA